MEKPFSASTTASNELLNLPQADFTVSLDSCYNTAFTLVTS